ncbi:Hypp4119 [Branchiostoma lanceolatum]|uniref:Hypp4119 protein n=1 Tax=Branchiostoma lanceolatum TaxID=7740 RepID=A0A8K0A700_BRALA|nr:Hypp4119 [Branchiostoma lanceolatum]
MNTVMKVQKVLIIGAGFVGSSLAASLQSSGVQVCCTRRQEGEEGTVQKGEEGTVQNVEEGTVQNVEEGTVQKGEEGTVQFVLENEETWRNLPMEVDGVVWTLPAKPLSQVQRLHDAYLHSILDEKKPVIVYGSTSRYHVDEAHQWVDEKTKKTQKEDSREEGEDFLQEKGATVLVLAGIWGESKNGQSRHPKSWFEKGYIKNFNKFLNLAHVDDIIKVTEEVMRRHSETRGQAINVCDGNPMLWRDIIVGPLSCVHRLYDTYLRSILDSKKQVIVYGTTGRYHVEEEHQWVDEKTKYKQTESGREEGEDFLQEKGASVLVLVGIWGESNSGQLRSPKSWIEKGYHINSINKYLNLAHVDDIVKATEEVLNRPEFIGQAINVCDGNPMLWRDITLGFGLELPATTQDPNATAPTSRLLSRPSKRVSNGLLQSIMGKDYKFKTVVDPDTTGA